MTIDIAGLGAGYAIGCIGQSNIQRWFSTGADPGTSASASLREFSGTPGSWSTIGGAAEGAKIFGNALITALSAPVGLLNYALGGTGLYDEASWQPGEPGYNAFVAGAASVGGLDAIIWIQGENDAARGVTQPQYTGALIELIANLRAACTNVSGFSTIPFFIVPIGRNTTASYVEAYQAIRDASTSVAEATEHCYVAGSFHDFALADSVHITDYTTIAQRLAVAVADVLDGSPSADTYLAPRIVSIAEVSATVTDCTIAHASGGTDFTPTSGIEGFRVYEVGGALKAISGAVRQSASVIRLTHASVSGDRLVTYCRGGDANITRSQNPTELASLVVDNATVARALQPLSGLSTVVPGVSSGNFFAAAQSGPQAAVLTVADAALRR